MSTEDCDDGNVFNGDGCSADCIIESNWTCTGSPSFCIPECPFGMRFNNYTQTCDPI